MGAPLVQEIGNNQENIIGPICPKGLFTPLEIMPRCSAAGLDFRIISAGFNAPLEFLTGFTGDSGRARGIMFRVCLEHASRTFVHSKRIFLE